MSIRSAVTGTFHASSTVSISAQEPPDALYIPEQTTHQNRNSRNCPWLVVRQVSIKMAALGVRPIYS